MKILISGITGFIGRPLSIKLQQEGHELYAVLRNPAFKSDLKKRNITCFVDNNSMDALSEYFQASRFDGVVHCASHYCVEHTSGDINDLVQSNLLFATKILECSVKTGVNWFINTGTFWQHYQNNAYSPVNLYAATKQAFESIARFYLETTDIGFVTLKLNDTYGPGDTRPKIFNLWKKTAESGALLEMSEGEQYIDTVYIDDVVGAYTRMIELLQEDKANEIYGKSFAVSSDNRLMLRDMAAVFERVADKKLNITWGGRPYRKREVMMPWTGGEPIPGWKPKVSLEDGIAALLQYLEEG